MVFRVMVKLAKLSSRLNWPHATRTDTPRFFLLTDHTRLPDPTDALTRLPRGAVVILRHPDPSELEVLARRTMAPAHRLGLKVLLAADVRLVQKLRADGVHLSAARARQGPLRIAKKRPGFLITAAAHGVAELKRAAHAGADVALVSPVFITASHPGAPTLGPIRFARLTRNTSIPVIALGGVTLQTARRLRLGPAHGLAAIDGW